MSTIDSILVVLRKTLEEKKQPLNEQYEVTSHWLARELDLVRKLVHYDPRDPTQSRSLEEMKSVPVPIVTNNSNYNNKKRKSPETSSEIKFSPDQKRPSVDVKDLLVAAGLPSDLNKLKKEQLLDELAKRGVTNFTMKNLKSELIDALENATTAEKRNRYKPEHDAVSSMTAYENIITSEEPMVREAVSMIENPADALVKTTTEPTSTMKPCVRQGSLMDEFRKKVYSNNPSDAETIQTLKIENEFRNRQERHRDSIARKSQILEAPMSPALQPSITIPTTDAEVMVSGVLFSFSAASSTAMDVGSPIHSISQSAELAEEEVEETVSVQEEDDIKDAVPEQEERINAHERAETEEVVESPCSQRPLEQSQEDVEEEEPEEGEVNDIEEEKEVEEEEKEEDTASVQSEFLQNTSNSVLSQQRSFMHSTSGSTHSKNSVSSSSSVQSQQEATKKPSNLVNLAGSSSSFLDKPTNKPVVTALLKAKQLKEQEELKEQKRKELKAAKLAAAQSAASGSGKEPRSPWGKVAKGISKVAENVNKMGGMVGFVKKSSTTADAPVTKPFSSNITANSNTSSNNITKQPFDVRATESKSSLSAAPFIVAAPASVSAPIQVVATVDTPVVIAAKEISLSKPIIPVTADITPTPTSTSPAALPPKSAIKDIIAKYNEAIHSPIVAKPLPVLPTAATTAPVNISPVAAPTAPPVMTVAPVIAPFVPSVSAAIAEPQVLRERVIPTAQVAPVVPVVIPLAPPVQEVEEVEEEEDYDPANNYQIEDTPDSDDSDAGSGTDDEQESNKKKQQIPEWARGDALREALEKQYGLHGHTPMDPDSIFPEVQSCSLEEIFGRREGVNRKYAVRTSSAHWDADELTLVEKRQYRVHMGYDAAVTGGGNPTRVQPSSVRLH